MRLSDLTGKQGVTRGLFSQNIRCDSAVWAGFLCHWPRPHSISKTARIHLLRQLADSEELFTFTPSIRMLLPRSAPLEKNPPSRVTWPLRHSCSANRLRSVPCLLCLWLHGAAKIRVCLVKLCKWFSPLSYFAIFALQHFDLWRHRNFSVDTRKVFVPVQHGKAKMWAITVTNIRPAIALLLQLTAVLMRTESYKYESVFIWDTLLN